MTMVNRDPWIELLGVIAHDLKQPITSVKMYAEMLESVGPLTDKQRQFIERILGSLVKMDQRVSMLNNIAWLDADKPIERSECDIGVFINATVGMVETSAARASVTIETHIAPDIGFVMGDIQRIPQVIDNLVGNAIKYNNQGGTVTITATGDAKEIRVSVRDTGKGIPEDEVPHVFDHYFRAGNAASSIEGTGLGLAIAKGVVEKHGGRIWVDSEEGVGSTFTFTLPRGY